jgi:hypothetical protein
VVSQLSALTDTATTVTGLADGTYAVCVRARDAAGGTRVADTDPYPIVLTIGIALGQPSVGTATANGGPVGENSPLGTWTDGTRLVVADTGNHRVLIWNQLPVSANTPPDLVLGQPDQTTVTPSTGGVSAQSMNGPITVHFDGANLVVAEYTGNRVLIWHGFPVRDRQPADVVVGQPSMSTSGEATTATTLRRPSSAFSDGTDLYVTDDSNMRVLIYRPLPVADGAAASVVLGQGGSFTTNTWDGTGATADSIDDPSSVWVDSGRLIVTDSGNNRVLVWNRVPQAQTPADLVLGQPDFTTTTDNTGGPSAASIHYPTGATVYKGGLYVADRENHRVLVWRSFPATSFAPADEVYGQPDFATVTPSTGGVSASSMNGAQFVSVTDELLIVSELYGNRTLLIPRR